MEQLDKRADKRVSAARSSARRRGLAQRLLLKTRDEAAEVPARRERLVQR